MKTLGVLWGPPTFWRKNMGINDWNISNIVMTILREESKYSYLRIAQELGVSEQSLSDWRKGVRTPQKQNIDTICQGVPSILPVSAHEHFLSILKDNFKNAGDLVVSRLTDCHTISDALSYLYTDFQTNLVHDKLYLLLNSHEGNELLREIILKKIHVNEKRTSTFQVEELGYIYQKELENKNIHWKLDLDHCFLIKFKDTSRKYSYKVLVDFNFNQKEHDQAGDYAEARDAARAYGVKMLLLFGSFPIPHNELRLFLDSNIYSEEIQMKELRKKRLSKDYIYSFSDTDAEMEAYANKYADLIIGQLMKYHSVIFKNILFETKRNMPVKMQNQYVFWDARYATRHHINFQTNRIEYYLNQSEIPRGGKAMAIGYMSFPGLLRLEKYFDHIYLMDNSNTSVKMFEQQLSEQFGEQNPRLLDKITFITFTSSMYSSLSDLHHLYHSIDFILIGSGSGSFIKKMKAYYQMCNSWLTNSGALYVSYLNQDFMYDFIDQVTSEQNLEFFPRIAEKRASAFLANTTEKYDLYCETYEFNELKDISEKYFTAESFFSYPLASILEGTNKRMLQNILKELDKEYSSKGFISKTFSNCRGYYLDAFLKKRMYPSLLMKIPEDLSYQLVPKDDIKDFQNHHLKLLLLAEPAAIQKQTEHIGLPREIYLFLLPDGKKLPETDQKEICLGTKKLRFLTIAEINTLGLEFQNIPVFLNSRDSHITLNKNYDSEIKGTPGNFYYLDNGTEKNIYKVSGNDLVQYLERQGFYESMISNE